MCVQALSCWKMALPLALTYGMITGARICKISVDDNQICLVGIANSRPHHNRPSTTSVDLFYTRVTETLAGTAVNARTSVGWISKVNLDSSEKKTWFHCIACLPTWALNHCRRARLCLGSSCGPT